MNIKPGTEPAALERLADSLRALQVPGMLNLTAGPDAGLREGNAGFAIVADFDDEAAYRVYDEDAEHNRIRRELVAPVAESVTRCQYRVY